MSQMRCSIRTARRAIRPLALVILCAWVSDFPPKTHEFMTTEILESVAAGKVTIDGQDYSIDRRVRAAIEAYPAYYRGGAIGPDAFPDIAFGQAYIHPNGRCPDDSPGNQACSTKPNATYTYQGLDHVYRRAWAYYDSLGGDARGQQALAFAYGFLTHAAGDVWGHTLVNTFAQGVYPPMADVARNPSARLIAIRHIVADEYIGTKTPRTDMPIATPRDFIYSTFITDPHAQQMGDGYLFAHFMKLRERLQRQKDAVPRSAPRGCVSMHSPTGKCLQWLSRGPILGYLDLWIASIDRGLQEWPQMSEDVAIDLFKYQSVSRAEARVSEFATDRLAPRVAGPPGSIAKLVHEITDEAWKGMPDVEIGPVEQFKDDLFKQAFGLSPRELESYVTSPESWLARPELRFAPGAREQLDSLMSLQPDGTFSPSRFAAYGNAIVLAKLLLMPMEEFQRLLAHYDVSSTYDITDASQPMNPMLGWIRSLDADHQWQPGAPAGQRATEGMPFWRDCRARNLVFRKLFADWEHVAPFPDLDDGCAVLSGHIAQ